MLAFLATLKKKPAQRRDKPNKVKLRRTSLQALANLIDFDSIDVNAGSGIGVQNQATHCAQVTQNSRRPLMRLILTHIGMLAVRDFFVLSCRIYGTSAGFIQYGSCGHGEPLLT